MRKILLLLLALVMLFAITAPAYAVSWGDPVVTSPYTVSVIPVRQRTVFGQTYLEQYQGAAVAGDDIYAAVRVEVPENPRAGTLTIKAQNAVLDCVLTSTLPMTQGVYYLSPAGGFTTAFTVISGYATGNPTVTATVTGTERVTSVGQYGIVRSDGYIVTANGKGMQFCPDAKGKVYSSFVLHSTEKHKLTSYLLLEDSEEGVIARDVLRVLGIDGTTLLNGGIYMTDRLLAANFGLLVDVEVSKTWGDVGILVSATPAPTLSVTPITEVPNTGWETNAFVIVGICILCLLGWLNRKDITSFINAMNKEEKHTD